MSKNQLMFFMVILTLFGTIWGSVRDKQVKVLNKKIAVLDQQLVQEGGEASPVVVELQTQLAAEKAEIVRLREQLIAGAPEGAFADPAELAACTKRVQQLQDALAVAQEKAERMTAAEAKLASLEGMKSKMANTVDTYSAQAQEFSVEVEKNAIHIQALEKALENKNRALGGCNEDLKRARLNMDVLLSQIAAQQESLRILEEARQ
ncbi:MAG: hypothetical protein H8E79_08145 [Desulfobulbaceae bacterium]|uniref:Uncharacterized protein n=1 Tax=Candidatus Desulfatifera sulfidica TaxID=2841691 RepID=A0A8J6NCI7_9BACT|nr:hypothetical protein [Candidatus Desulfatifera sulfidica]